MSAEERRGTLLHEKDGDFNPGWAVFLAYAALGVLLNGTAIAVALLAPDKAWLAVVGAMIFDALTMIVTAIIVVPIARAKLLANSRTVASGLSALGKLGGGGNIWTDDERGDFLEREPVEPHHGVLGAEDR